MPLTPEELDAITHAAIGCGIRVHSETGPGLLESTYQACYAYELAATGLSFRCEVPVPVVYRDVKLNCGYRLDFLIADRVIVEVKSVAQIAPIHVAQMLTYLRLTNCRVGLLINFNVTRLTDGVKRVVNRFDDDESASGVRSQEAPHLVESGGTPVRGDMSVAEPKIIVETVTQPGKILRFLGIWR